VNGGRVLSGCGRVRPRACSSVFLRCPPGGDAPVGPKAGSRFLRPGESLTSISSAVVFWLASNPPAASAGPPDSSNRVRHSVCAVSARLAQPVAHTQRPSRSRRRGRRPPRRAAGSGMGFVYGPRQEPQLREAAAEQASQRDIHLAVHLGVGEGRRRQTRVHVPVERQ
jgi:hypothetical protein